MPPPAKASPPAPPPRTSPPAVEPVAVVESSATASAAPRSASELWNQLLDGVGKSIAWSWLRSFEPASLDERTFKLVARPGDKHMLAFATEPRRKDLQTMIASILGRPIKLELVAADTAAEPAQPAAAPTVRLSQDQRREAMRLPLVREVVDLFEASLIDVKPEPTDDSTVEPIESEQPDV